MIHRKAIGFSFVLFFLAVIPFPVAPLQSAPVEKIRAGILDFTAQGVSESDAQVVGALFRGEMVHSRFFQVLDRRNMESILKEQAFQNSGCTDSTCAVAIGRLLNVEVMAYGSLSRLGSSYFIQAEMVNVETGKIVLSAKKKFTSLDDADRAVVALVQEIDNIKEGVAPKNTTDKPMESLLRPGDPNQLASWKQQEDPDFYMENGAIVGGSGRLIWSETLTNFDLEFDVEFKGGRKQGAFGVLWRGGGPEGQSPTRGYTFGAQWTGTYNIFSGYGGGWTCLTTDWGRNQPWKPTKLVDPRKNRVRLEVRDTQFTLYFNGNMVDQVTDTTHRTGRLGIGPLEGAVAIFSQIKITPR